MKERMQKAKQRRLRRRSGYKWRNSAEVDQESDGHQGDEGQWAQIDERVSLIWSFIGCPPSLSIAAKEDFCLAIAKELALVFSRLDFFGEPS